MCPSRRSRSCAADVARAGAPALTVIDGAIELADGTRFSRGDRLPLPLFGAAPCEAQAVSQRGARVQLSTPVGLPPVATPAPAPSNVAAAVDEAHHTFDAARVLAGRMRGAPPVVVVVGAAGVEGEAAARSAAKRLCRRALATGAASLEVSAPVAGSGGAAAPASVPLRAAALIDLQGSDAAAGAAGLPGAASLSLWWCAETAAGAVRADAPSERLILHTGSARGAHSSDRVADAALFLKRAADTVAAAGRLELGAAGAVVLAPAINFAPSAPTAPTTATAAENVTVTEADRAMLRGVVNAVRATVILVVPPSGARGAALIAACDSISQGIVRGVSLRVLPPTPTEPDSDHDAGGFDDDTCVPGDKAEAGRDDAAAESLYRSLLVRSYFLGSGGAVGGGSGAPSTGPVGSAPLAAARVVLPLSSLTCLSADTLARLLPAEALRLHTLCGVQAPAAVAARGGSKGGDGGAIDPTNMAQRCVVGWVLVVERGAASVTVLAPAAGPLPSTTLLVGAEPVYDASWTGPACSGAYVA
jgi:hypothetical protein